MRPANPRRRGDLKVQTLDGETVVLDQRLLQIHRLNSTATYVWLACDGQQSPQKIARKIQRRFHIDAPAALRDVNTALELFAAAGLLECEAVNNSTRT